MRVEVKVKTGVLASPTRKCVLPRFRRYGISRPKPGWCYNIYKYCCLCCSRIAMLQGNWAVLFESIYLSSQIKNNSAMDEMEDDMPWAVNPLCISTMLMYIKSAFWRYVDGIAGLLFRKRYPAEALRGFESRGRAKRFSRSPLNGIVLGGLERKSILGTLSTCTERCARFLMCSVQWRNRYDFSEAASRGWNGHNIYCCGICTKCLHPT